MERFPSELTELLGDAYRSAGRMDEEFLTEAEIDDISVSELHIIRAIGVENGGSTISSLAARLELTLPTITVAVNKLQQKGYVKKVKSEEDKRSVTVSLSHQGKKTYSSYRKWREKMLESINDGLNDTDRQMLARAIHAFNRSLRRVMDESKQKLLSKKSRREREDAQGTAITNSDKDE